MLILAFGASVTAQKTGYAHRLKQILSKFDESIVFQRIFAGGSHFDEAGYALLPDVFEKKPDLIILDWHSTSKVEFDQFLWDSFLSELLDKEIYIIISLLPRKDCIEKGKFFPNFYQAKESSSTMIDVIDGYEFASFSPSLHLRDVVHTTNEGSYLYAEEIFIRIKNILKKISLRKENYTNDKPVFYLSKHLRPVIGKHEISKEEHMVFENIELECFLMKSGVKPYILLDMFIGPDSGFLEISSTDQQKKLVQIWDPWCYYSRQSYKKIPLHYLRSQKEKILIKVSNKIPNYSSCRNKDFDFAPYATKLRVMRLKSIYTVSLQILKIKIKKCNI